MEGTLSEIRMFAGNFAPLYWAYCNGATISIAENTALFSLIGTTYGGNGQTTFLLPNFQGRIAVGTGQGPGLAPVDLGEVAGSNSVTMTSSTMPMHNHVGALKVSTGAATSASPANGYPAVGNGTTSDGKTIQYSYGAATPDGTSTMGGLTVASAGSNQPFSVANPTLALNFIICVEGIYPSRN